MTETLRVRPTRREDASLLTRPFVAIGAAMLAYFTADGVLIAALPRYVAGPLGASSVAVGVVVGAFSVSAFFLRPWAGRLGDVRGRRLLLLVGAGLFVVSVLGYGLASGPAALTALRLLTGAGEAFFFVGGVTAVTDLAPDHRRGEAMSLASLSLYVGIGAGPLLGELTLDRLGFGAAWLLAAALGAAALVLARQVPDTRPAELLGAAAADAPRPRLVHPDGLLPGAVLLASILGMAGFLAFVPLYALELGMGGARVVLLVFAGVVIAIRSLGARLPDRLGPAVATRMALALSAAGLLAVGTWTTPTGLLAGAVVLGLGVGLLTPSVFALAVQRVAPRERGAVVGTVSAFLDIALGVGPMTLGFVAAAVGLTGTFLAGAAVAAAGFVLVVATRLGRPSTVEQPHLAA